MLKLRQCVHLLLNNNKSLSCISKHYYIAFFGYFLILGAIYKGPVTKKMTKSTVNTVSNETEHKKNAFTWNNKWLSKFWSRFLNLANCG